MKVIWTPQALQDRTDIWDYIALDNPKAAAHLDELFSQAAARLGDHPQLGRTGTIQGTRELIPHKNYRLVYEIIDAFINHDSLPSFPRKRESSDAPMVDSRFRGNDGLRCLS